MANEQKRLEKIGVIKKRIVASTNTGEGIDKEELIASLDITYGWSRRLVLGIINNLLKTRIVIQDEGRLIWNG